MAPLHPLAVRRRAACLAALAALLPAFHVAAADPRPNIVLMLADDQGWDGLSVAMHPTAPGSRSAIVQTPNLERLAAQGMRFSAAYAPAPVCSPTRISIQTGKSPARLHWTKAGKPFFIQLSWNALHAAGNARRSTIEKYAKITGGAADDKRTTVAAITEDLDGGVGRVLEAIDRLGLAGTTYVLYTSDNGSGGGNKRGSLDGGKGSVWEGGVRVPFIVRGPGVAANSWCDVPVVGYDFLPTFAEWARVPAAKLPADLDGGSCAGLLAHGGTGQVQRPRRELVFHFPHYQSGNTPHSAIRLGDLKLLRFYEDGSVRLFDLAADIGERDDLARERPADAERLRKLLEEHLAAIDAQTPTPNPDHRAGAPAPDRRQPGGGRKARKKAAAATPPEAS
jgi:arylsulfatase A-like enzyme